MSHPIESASHPYECTEVLSILNESCNVSKKHIPFQQPSPLHLHVESTFKEKSDVHIIHQIVSGLDVIFFTYDFHDVPFSIFNTNLLSSLDWNTIHMNLFTAAVVAYFTII